MSLKGVPVGAARLFSCICLAASTCAALPPLEILPNDRVFMDLRRHEAQSGELLPGQSFPQDLRAADNWLKQQILSPWDSAHLLGRYPFVERGELIRWS